MNVSLDRTSTLLPPLTLELFKPSLQLVVVEGGLTREPGSRAGPPDGAEAGARPPAGAGGVRRAGGQGAGVVQGRGERAGESAGGALKLHHETPERKDSEETRHQGDAQRRELKFPSVSEVPVGSSKEFLCSSEASGEFPTVFKKRNQVSR